MPSNIGATRRRVLTKVKKSTEQLLGAPNSLVSGGLTSPAAGSSKGQGVRRNDQAMHAVDKVLVERLLHLRLFEGWSVSRRPQVLSGTTLRGLGGGP